MKKVNFEELLKEAEIKYNSYGSEWKKAYFDDNSGGFNVYHEKHQFSNAGGGATGEKTVGKMLANEGKQVEFLPETGKKMPDI